MTTAMPVRWTNEPYADPYTIMGDLSWGDYTVSADTDLTSAGSVELLGRVNQQGRNDNGLNAYHLRVSDTGAWSILKSDTSWNFTTLASGTTSSLGTNKWHTVSLTMQGTTLTAKVDSRTLGSATDGTWSQGQAGLGVVGYQADQFDNFSVTAAGTSPATHVGPVTAGVAAGKCVDTDGGSEADGTKVQLWDCTGSAGQSWTYTNQTLIINGKCLDVTGGSSANGAPVELWDCNGGSNQRWTAHADGTLTSGVGSGICLDDPAFSTANGTQLEIWNCNGGTNQKWTTP